MENAWTGSLLLSCLESGYRKTWDGKHVSAILRKCYSKIIMLSKLKYAGVIVSDLLTIYKLFIRSITEYCSVTFHHSLKLKQSHSLDRMQATCLKVILQDAYVSYNLALLLTRLDALEKRQEDRCLRFSLRCIKHSPPGVRA